MNVHRDEPLSIDTDQLLNPVLCRLYEELCKEYLLKEGKPITEKVHHLFLDKAQQALKALEYLNE